MQKPKFKSVIEIRNNYAVKFMKPYDAKLVHNPAHNAEYAEGVHSNNLAMESRFLLTYNTKLGVEDELIKPNNRIKLVNFLYGVFLKGEIEDLNTFFIAIQLLDRYLQVQKVSLSKLQIVGC